MDQLGETAKLGVLDVDMVVYLAQVPSLHSMRTFTEVGCRAHTHTTGIGKAILAQLSEDTVRQIIMQVGMPTRTTRSISGAGALLAELSLIRERGFSVDEQEQESVSDALLLRSLITYTYSHFSVWPCFPA